MQPRMSAGVIDFIAATAASINASWSHADARCNACLSLANTRSIGFRSGLSGGSYHRCAPAASIRSRITDALWLEWLYIITTSPRRRRLRASRRRATS